MTREDLEALEAELRREMAAARAEAVLAERRAQDAAAKLELWFGWVAPRRQSVGTFTNEVESLLASASQLAMQQQAHLPAPTGSYSIGALLNGLGPFAEVQHDTRTRSFMDRLCRRHRP